MNSLKVNVPCPKQWDELIGNESRRFCDQCQKHVHNLSVASERETQRLTRELETGGRICVAYLTTPTGGILRQPSPWRRWLGGLRSGLALLMPFGATGLQAEPPANSPGEHREARLSADGEIVMGAVAAPKPTPTPTPAPTPPMIFGEAVGHPSPSPTTPMIRGEAVAVPNPNMELERVATPTPKPTPFELGDAVSVPVAPMILGTPVPPTPTPTPSPTPTPTPE